jgi:hypothetical protein
MKKGVFILAILWVSLQCAGAELESLSEVFHLGKGILDKDKDGLADAISLCIVVPDVPSAFETAAASDIAARANFDSLVVDFSLVKRESEYNLNPSSSYPILIGSNLNSVKKWAAREKISLDELENDHGFVALYADKGQSGIVLAAGSDQALLQTAREFFLRWPFLWEIWGREEGDTYISLEEDLLAFFKTNHLSPAHISILRADFQFPTIKSPHDAIKKLRFNRGEIKDLSVTADFNDSEARAKAVEAVEELKSLHNRGVATEILSYPGCAQITLQLRDNEHTVQISLPRVGYPKRMLTPSYKPRPTASRTGKEFDLTSVFTTKGFYTDSDKDSIQDTLDSLVLIPQKTPSPGTQWLTSRLVLDTAGASFPIVYLDKEIENKDQLKAPILIGKRNLWNQRLIDAGKIKNLQLEDGWGKVQAVPQALNKSTALVIREADSLGLEKTLSYLGQNFPYFDEFGEGQAKVQDVPVALEEFLEGKHGSAEAYFWTKLKTYIEEIQDKKFSHFKLSVYLPDKNKKFVQHIQEFLGKTLDVEKIDIEDHALKDSKNIFQKEKEFSWEGEDAFHLIQQKIESFKSGDSDLNISLGVSESPEVRVKLKNRIDDLLKNSGIQRYKVDVLSSYKQGFFWILEEVLPAIDDKNVHHVLIRFAQEKEDFSHPKRFYS